MKWTLWFFGACTVLTLAVSLPATYAALRLFHDDGTPYGWVLAAFALLVYELGAVGAKLATLAIPQWRGRLTALTIALLSVTTCANYAHGYDLSQAADASPTLAAVLSHPAGAIAATFATAALFPALLFVFLSAFVARCEVAAASRLRAADDAARLADAHEDLRRVRAELAAAHATLAGERARPVLDAATLARLVVKAGAPEATVRGWVESGRLLPVEVEP